MRAVGPDAHSVKRTSLALLVLSSTLAFAEPVTGSLSTPSLRRAVQLVYVEKVDGSLPPPAADVVINQKGNTYLPHLVPVVVGTKVTFKSEDTELHNVFARQGTKVLFNQGQPAKMVFEKAFDTLGPVKLTCNIHKEMTAWVVVLQNPYWAMPDAKTGSFEIRGLPPGSYSLRLWGETLDDALAARKFPLTVGSPQAPVLIAER